MKSFYDFYEEMMANNVSGGQIAGTVEAGDEPPVNKKKKKWCLTCSQASRESPPRRKTHRGS